MISDFRKKRKRYNKYVMIKIIKKLYIAFCWIPLTLFILFQIYLNTLEGWGAWAASRIIIIPIMISFFMGFSGIVLVIIALKQKATILKLTIATLLTILPALWFIGKILL